MTDELAIRNLVAAVAQLADDGDVDAYLSLFTRDAVWEMPANPVVGLTASVRRGSEEIRAGVLERRAAGIQGPGSDSMHVITTVRVDVGAQAATGRIYWLFYGDTRTAPTVRSMGKYDDDYVRTDTGWKLARRRVTIG